MIKRTTLALLGTWLLSLTLAGPAGAEARIDPVEAGATVVTGTAEANQQLMLLHERAWLKTTANEQGAFRFELPAPAGQGTLYLEGEQDGDYVQESSITPDAPETPAPRYLGTLDGEWVFAGASGELSVLIDGKVYRNYQTVRVPVTAAKEAKAYIENNGIRSTLATIDLTKAPVIPFTLSESPADGRRITGKTLPRQRILIDYAGMNGANHAGADEMDQYVYSDANGDFDAELDVPFALRAGMTYTLSLPEVGSDAIVPEVVGQRTVLPLPKADSAHPVTLEQDSYAVDERIIGATYPDHAIYLAKKDGTRRPCGKSDATGYFSCANDSEDAVLALTVVSPSGATVASETLEILPRPGYWWHLDLDEVTNESDVLTGTALRYARIEISYSGTNGYSVVTRADADGKFRVAVPRRSSGTYTAYGELEYSNGHGYPATPASRLVRDTRPLATPTFAIYDGMMVVSAVHKKATSLSAELSIVHADGSFDAQSFRLSGSGGNFSTSPFSLAEGDAFTIYLKDSSGMESKSVAGRYRPLAAPTLVELTDVATEITGKTLPHLSVYYDVLVDGQVKRVATTSDELGAFRLPLDQKQRPGQLFAEATDEQNMVSLSLSYRDTTPPTLSFDPFDQRSTFFLWRNDGGQYLTFRFHYRDGTVTEDLRYDASSFTKWTHRKNLFDVTQVEVTATDVAGNTSKPLFLTPTDTTRPDAAVVDRTYPGDTAISGTAEANATIRVTRSGKTYENKADAEQHFSVQVPSLRPGDVVTVDVIDEAGNKNSSSVTREVVGVTKMTLSTDRKTLTIETNASYWMPADFRLEGASKTVTLSVRQTKWVHRMQTPLPNHAVVRARMTDDSGQVSSTYEQQFSDSIIPATPKLFSLTTGSTVVEGTAEPLATVDITINGKTYRTPIDARGRFALLKGGFSAGTIVTATTRDAAGNLSKRTSTKVSGILSLASTKLSSRATSLSSKTNAGATITLYKSGKKLKSATASRTGTFRLTLPKQKVGTRLVLKVTKRDHTTLSRTITVSK